LAQAKHLYKDRWESFVGNAGVLQSFAPQDVTTQEYLSKLSGQRLYWLKTGGTSTSQNLGNQPSRSTGTSENLQNLQGPIYWPQGLGAMDVGQAVLFLRERRARTIRAWLPDPEQKDDPLGIRAHLQRAKREAAG